MTTTKRPKRKTPKRKTPKPHPMAFVGEAPCTICGCEWFRPTIQFPDDAAELVEGTACANLWCVMIAQLRNEITRLKADRRALAKLAAETPQFDNPLLVWEAQALRDRVLARPEVTA